MAPPGTLSGLFRLTNCYDFASNETRWTSTPRGWLALNPLSQSSMNFAGSQCLTKLHRPLARDSRTSRVQLSQLAQPLEVFKTAVGDSGITEIQFAKLSQTLQLSNASVRYLSATEIQYCELAQTFELSNASVRYLSVAEIQ